MTKAEEELDVYRPVIGMPDRLRAVGLHELTLEEIKEGVEALAKKQKNLDQVSGQPNQQPKPPKP